MSKKHAYISEAENRLHQWKTEIQKFRVIAEVADKDAQIDYYQVIEQIGEREKEAIELFDKLKETDDEAQLEQYKRDFDGVGDQIETAIENARAVIN